MANQINWNDVEMVRFSDGSVNTQATLAKLEASLENYVETEDIENRLVAAAVHQVFDQFPGAGINMPALRTKVLMVVGFTNENFQEKSDRIDSFVRASSEFVISKGPKGGVHRVADLTKKS